MEARTRVEVVTDPCHPTMYNPIRPVFPDNADNAVSEPEAAPSTQHRLVAAKTLAEGELLGLYWGDVKTSR
jgi:hypothetical protein